MFLGIEQGKQERKMTMTWEEYEVEYCRTALREPGVYDTKTSGHTDSRTEDLLEKELSFAILKYDMVHYTVREYEPEFKVLVRDYNCGNS